MDLNNQFLLSLYRGGMLQECGLMLINRERRYAQDELLHIAHVMVYLFRMLFCD